MHPARDPRVSKHHNFVVSWQVPFATSQVGNIPLIGNLHFKGSYFLPAVLQDLLEMPLFSENGLQRYPVWFRKQMTKMIDRLFGLVGNDCLDWLRSQTASDNYIV